MGAAGNAGTSVAADKALAKQKRRKATAKPVAAPKGDVASSGADYGLKRANRHKATPQYKADLRGAAKAKLAQDLAEAAHTHALKAPEHHGGSTLATALAVAKIGKKVSDGPMGLVLSPINKTIRNAVRATAEHPVAVPVNTAKGLRDSVLNIPGGLASVATQSPVKTGKAMVADYVHRYGESDKEQRKRFAKEGLAPELLDATAAVGGGTAATGRALGVAARAGHLGAKLERVAAEARPALRTTGGAAKPQALSPNLFKATAQKALDTKRATSDAKAAAGATHEVDGRMKSHVAEATRANEKAGKVVEVTPIKGASKAQRVAIAKLKSRGVHLLRGEQHHKVEQVAHRALNQLNAHERQAFYAVAEGHAPTIGARRADGSTVTVDDVHHHLETRKASILAARPEGTKVRRRVDEVRTLDDLHKHADKAFTPRLAATVKGLREQDVAVGRADPGLRAAQRLLTRYGPQAKHLGLERGVVPAEHVVRPGQVPEQRYRDEGVGEFVKRVQKAADVHGLERPLYFPHEADSLDLNPDFASRAVGGAKAIKEPFKRTYTLFNEGRRDTSPDVYLTGLARSIKRKHNWNLVADQFDRSTFKGLRNMPLSQLKAELRHRGIDPADVTFWNPGRYRKQLQAGEVAAVDKPNRYGDVVSPPEELGVERMQGALADSVRSGTHDLPEELAKTKGWSALPKSAGDEILHAAHGENKYVRGYDIARGKSARLMLGANPAWNAFQVISNAGLGTIATKGALPIRMAQAERLYNSLSPETKQLVDAATGEGAGSHGNMAKLGASSSGKLTTKYRQTMASPNLDKKVRVAGTAVTPSVRQLNPIQAGFTFDHWQNGHFRRALLVHSLKQTGEKLDDAAVNRMLKNPADAEAHGKFMNDWLGDYTTLTHRERTTLARYPMFYGYLRHSTKLLFKTLPADHPLLLTAGLYLGQLQHEELVKLGVGDLPWSNGKFYYTSNGKVHEVPLGRANPVANQLTSTGGFGQLVSFFPPFVQAVANQIASKDLYTGKGWDAYGKSGFGKPAGYFTHARARIFGEDLLGSAAPYRTAEKMTMFGPQGDDSMLFAPRPVVHAGGTKAGRKLRKQDRQRTEQDRKDAAGTSGLIHQLVPILPKVSRDPEIAKAMADKGKKPHHKPRKVNYGFGAGGSSGGGLGVGGSGASKGASLAP